MLRVLHPPAALLFTECLASYTAGTCASRLLAPLSCSRFSSQSEPQRPQLQQPAQQTMTEQQQRPSHHLPPSGWFGGGPKFTNPWPTWGGDPKMSDFFKAIREMRKAKMPMAAYLAGNLKPSAEDFQRAFPLAPLDYRALAAPPADAIQATWLGHASVLVQMEGVTFITDPVLSERCSPVQFMGPKRVVPPAWTPEDDRAPKPDFICISHNHYDHLDLASVKRIYKRFDDSLAWYVPLGLKAWFASLGINNVTEMDWWQQVQHPGSKVNVVLTPAQHWSSRTHWDRRQTLWGGFAVVGQKQRFWFAGDTGYCPVFKEIGERLGPFDLSCVPIGAYEPRGFMRPQHTNPEDGVQIHLDVRSKRSIAIHCCTFFLTLEPMDEPPQRLAAMLQREGLPADAFIALQHGGLLQTTDGQTLNQPLVLPVTAPAPVPGAVGAQAADRATSGVTA